MPNEWSFRHELLSISQKWPWLVLCCVLGALTGWLIAEIWPSSYRATRELYVGLNAYRAINDLSVSEYAGIKLVNANDYKNWQMSSLNTMIFMDSVIDETLLKLRNQDAYWDSVSRDDFSQNLHVYWRNAGKWRLVAEHTNPDRAEEAVSAWQQVVVDTVHNAVSQSQEALLLELQLRSLSEEKNSTTQNIEEMNYLLNQVRDWREQLGASPNHIPPEDSERQQIWQLAVLIDENHFQDIFPSTNSPREEYLNWLSQTELFLNRVLGKLDQTYKDLQLREAVASDQFSDTIKNSLGLSASLDVDKISDSRTILNITRPTGLMMLCGSILGLFSWLGYWVVRTSLRGRS